MKSILNFTFIYMFNLPSSRHMLVVIRLIYHRTASSDFSFEHPQSSVELVLSQRGYLKMAAYADQHQFLTKGINSDCGEKIVKNIERIVALGHSICYANWSGLCTTSNQQNLCVSTACFHPVS